MRRQDFDFLVNLLKRYAGWDFNDGQYFVVDKRISNFIREKGYANVEELVAELRLGAKPLVAQVVENLALSDTSFFRNYDVFQRFENTVLPNLRENNRAAKRLRVWSVGCSTGQETYSIAMCIHRQFLGLKEWNVNIIGSDISSTAIFRAQRGLYNNFEIQTGLNARDILTYFHKEDGMWSVNDELRRMVEFRRYNLLHDVTQGEMFEVIFCRNVLRFFTPSRQREILFRLSKRQNRGGILYLGKNEHIAGIEEFYSKLSGFNGVYMAKGIHEDVVVEKPRLSVNMPEEEPAQMPRFVRPDALLSSRLTGRKDTSGQ